MNKPRGNSGSSRLSALAVLLSVCEALTVPYWSIADDHEQTAFVEAKVLAAAKPDHADPIPDRGRSRWSDPGFVGGCVVGGCVVG